MKTASNQNFFSLFSKTTQRIPPLLGYFLMLLVPLCTYASVLLIPFPFPFRPLSLAVRYSFLITLVGISIVFYFLFNLRGRLGALASSSGILALFSLSILGLWVSGQSTSSTFGSLLPMYDEWEYYQDALRLLAGGNFSPFSSWRPLFPSFLSLILFFTGNHLQLSIAILGLLAAIACYLFVREVQQTFGPLAAVMSLLVVFFYYRQRISGMVMSEQLGFTLGALGLTLILHSTHKNQRSILLVGLFSLSLALNARPGTLFVLPALALWAGWAFRKDKFFSWSVFIFSCLVILSGFVLNSLVLRFVSSEPSMLFSNFAYTLYGLVTGGRHFSSATSDHPELLTLSANERFLRTYAYVWEAFLQNPFGIIQGAWSEWALFLSNTGYSVFSYFASENPVTTLISRLALYALSLIGMIRSIIQHKAVHYGLIWISALAIFLSVPFVPPGDAYGMRLYAATIPFIALFPAVGISLLFENYLKRLPWLWHQPAAANDRARSNPAMIYSLILAPVVLASPFLVKQFLSHPITRPVSNCPAETDTLYVSLSAGSYVNVRPENEFFLDRLPDFHFGRFFRQAHGLPDSALAEIFDTIETPATLYKVIDRTDFRSAWLLINTELLPSDQGFFRICGTWDQRPAARNQGIFLPKSIEKLPNP